MQQRCCQSMSRQVDPAIGPRGFLPSLMSALADTRRGCAHQSPDQPAPLVRFIVVAVDATIFLRLA